MLKRLKALWTAVQLQSQRIKLPLFEGLSLYDVFSFFFRGIVEGRVTNRAGSVAYSFFIALFPFIIFLFTLIPYFNVDTLQQEIFNMLYRIMPPDTFDAAQSTIKDVLENKRGGLLSFGFIFALLFATNGVNSLISNFNHSAHQLETRSFWKQQLVAMLLTSVITILFLVAVILIIFSSTVLNEILSFMHLDTISPFIVETVRLLLMLLVVMLTITLLYNYGPAKRREWRFISPGAILATVLIIVSSFGFSYYVSNFSQYNKLYGSIGTLLVILLWIYINALVLILGFELNASIASAKNKREIKTA
jgi:membrane protein